ncbi:MAG: hypothetical protein ABR985_17515 [Methanotrichaceae archaeon]|jgi:non-homologous end joining protein Ku
MMTKTVDKLTVDLDLRLYHDGYKERIEAMITSKMKERLSGERGEAKEASGQEHDIRAKLFYEEYQCNLR